MFLKTFFREIKNNVSKIDLYEANKSITEGLNEDKIKTYFLFLVDLTDNNLFRIIVVLYPIIYTYVYIYIIMFNYYISK